ncbi:YeeE/YedE family protein [Magnetovibrio sp.]|uniref:YeeE/YedE family protein n=1 Tax=Magnetovibrio sp. TaxID=2024836 RepID=UPI002F93FB39
MQNEFTLILITSLACGLAAGFVLHRSDFCVTAMFRDFFLFRDVRMLRVLVFMIVVSMALVHGARAMGLIAYYPFPLLGAMSLTNILGGVVFGIGMVLAGGCVVGTLYKMGSGSVLSAVAFAGLLIGSALYAEFHPAWAGLTKQLAIFGTGKTLPEVIGLDPNTVIIPILAAGIVLVTTWARRGQLVMPAFVDGYIQPWLTAIALAVIGLVSYVVVGMPLGITTSYAKLGATVESWIVPDHVASLVYFQGQGLKYTPPFGDQMIAGGAGPAFDAVAAIQYPLVGGIVLGALVSALLLREWKLVYRVPARQYASVLVGGMLVGMAARMVPACNVWHLWGGVPILAGQSLLYVVGLMPGAWLGSVILSKYVVRAPA